jgi:hypothetical protein
MPEVPAPSVTALTSASSMVGVCHALRVLGTGPSPETEVEAGDLFTIALRFR